MIQKKIITVLLIATLVLFTASPAYGGDDEPASGDTSVQESTEASASDLSEGNVDAFDTLDEVLATQRQTENNTDDAAIPEVPEEQLGASGSYHPDEIIVVFLESDCLQQVEALAVELQEYAQIAAERAGSEQILDMGQDTSEYSVDEALIEQLDEGVSLEPTALVEIPDKLTVAQAVAIAQDTPNVISAQPNYLLYSIDSEVDTLGVSNDPYLQNQENYQWSLYKTNALEAWDNPHISALSSTLSDLSPTVAAIDTGAYLSHPDLTANLDIAHAWDAANDRSLHGDIDGHGTMVAGFLSAVTNNGVGVAGLANNRVRVLPINVFKATDAGIAASTSDVIKAINKAIEYKTSGAIPNIRVINMSLGGYYLDGNNSVLDVSYEIAVASNSVFHQKILEAREEGILIVAAAGNEGSKSAYKNTRGVNCFCFPSDFDEVLSVTSTTMSDTRATTSSYNQYKDIAAPGNNTASTSYSVTLGTASYGAGGGTSYASPMVAASAALLFAVDPALTPAKVMKLLCENSVDLGASGRDDEFGWGRLDVEAAVKAVDDDALLDGQPIPNGTYTFTSVKSELNLDAASSGALRGTNIQQAAAAPILFAQRFDIVYDAATDSYKILNCYSKLALDVSGASKEVGANVQLWTDNGTLAQRWSAVLVEGSADTYVFYNMSSGLVLDVASGSLSSGANIQQWSPNGTDAQRWRLASASPDGPKVIASLARSLDGKVVTLETPYSHTGATQVVDVPGATTESWVNLNTWIANNTAAQRYRLVAQRAGDGYTGYFSLVNIKSGKALDVMNGQASLGAGIHQYMPNGTVAQLFSAVDTGSGDGTAYLISAINPDFALDISGGNPQNGSKVQLWSWNRTQAQKFVISEVKALNGFTDGVYAFRNVNSGRHLEVMDIIKGANVQQGSINLDGSRQRFIVAFDASTGYYTVSNGELALDVAGGSKESGTNVQLWTPNGTMAQYFYPVRVKANTYVFYNVNSFLVLDVVGGSLSYGANVQQWTSNGTGAQGWVLERVE